MARKRMIDPGIWDSEQVQTLSPAQFKLYIYLISQADDEGRLKVSLPLLRARVHPINGPDEKSFKEDLDSIVNCGLVKRYGENGEYLCHPNWKLYQTINKPHPSHIPDISVTTTVPVPDISVTTTVPVPPNRIEKNRKEGKGKEVTAVAAPETAFFKRIEDGFLKHNGGRFTDYGKERAAIHKLIEKARARDAEHFEDLLVSVCAAFWKLKQSDTKGYWRDQPFLPSRLNSSSIWDGVLETMRRDEVPDEVKAIIAGGAP